MFARVKLRVFATEPLQREVHDFKKADWTALMAKLTSTNWAEVFDTSGADEAAERFTALVLGAVRHACLRDGSLRNCTPNRETLERKHAQVPAQVPARAHAFYSRYCFRSVFQFSCCHVAVFVPR